MNTERIQVPPEASDIVSQAITQYNVVWIHTQMLANAFGIWRWPHSVIDVDDVPSGYWRVVCQNSSSLIERARTGRLAWQWRRRERHLFERFTLGTVCSAADKTYLGDDPRIHVIPNGFEVPTVRTIAPILERPRLGMIGTFQYMPNVDGLKWFLREVWPTVLKSLPNAELRVVGSRSDDGSVACGPQVTGLGYVNDPTEELRTWSAMIVPLRIGGGTRVKIAEAFARGCPVISTSLGAYGYDVQDGENILLADTVKDFAVACVRVLQDGDLRDRLGAAAACHFDRLLSWDAITPAVAQTVEACLIHSHRASPSTNQWKRLCHRV
jgi:glycosyltransferase involved in cell wall biosynthesis